MIHDVVIHLLGKRADTVRQSLNEVFEEAVWRQPSVVLLDDLDHITGAATTPEQEQGAEAVLHHHIAQSIPRLQAYAIHYVGLCLKQWPDGDTVCVCLCACVLLRLEGFGGWSGRTLQFGDSLDHSAEWTHSSPSADWSAGFTLLSELL